jgi:magnesium transporter
MLHISLCSKDGEFLQTQDVSQIQQTLQSGTHRVWVDMDDPTPEELDLLDTVFHFHPLAIEDVKGSTGIPKINVYEDYTFLVLHRLFYHFETETCEPREFQIFFSDRFVVTIHTKQLSRTFAATRDLIREDPREIWQHGTSYVLLHLLELAIRDYEPVMEQWQETLDQIEHRVLRGTKDRILDQILQFKKLVATMRKSLLPEREVIKQLYEKPHLPYITPDEKPYFKNVIDDMNAFLHELDSLKEHAASVFEVYAAMLSIQMTESSNRLNFVMQRLTIAATIFLPLTFIVGVYGMNFEGMPEYHWRGAYYILWIVMTGIAFGLIYFFKRKKWL